MKTPEQIAEEREAVAKIHDAIYADDELRPEWERLVAKKFPAAKAKLPTVVASEAIGKERDAMRAEHEAWRKELDADRQSRDAERNASDLAARRRRLVDGFMHEDGTFVKIAAADVPKVEQYMKDNLVGSHDIAAYSWSAASRVAAPRTMASSRMEVPGLRGAGGDDMKWLEPGIKGTLQDLDAVTRDRAEMIWNDVTSGRNRDKWLAGQG